ncbi:hypothetical protein AArcS_0019 [Natranaeroarchaeum sulfidigenes]|uniref:Uncharacterized protein n=1 Tax=Natranaeroarchaeum sulfidigenes TaxID=2784880 RepID=A0A897MLM4_9EURY|nr:hypothetical protein AArcS_0019 [Natranaeroarchaeum sulfidigenes]
MTSSHGWSRGIPTSGLTGSQSGRHDRTTGVHENGVLVQPIRNLRFLRTGPSRRYSYPGMGFRVTLRVGINSQRPEGDSFRCGVTRIPIVSVYHVDGGTANIRPVVDTLLPSTYFSVEDVIHRVVVPCCRSGFHR